MAKQTTEFFPLLKIAVMLILGMVVSLFTDNYLSPVGWIAVLAVVVGMTFFLYRWPCGQSISILIASFLLGGYLMSHKRQTLLVPLPDVPVEYEAVVSSEPVRHGKVIQCDFLVLNEKDAIKIKTSILCDTITKIFEKLHVGDGVRAFSLLTPLQHDSYTSSSYFNWLQAQGYQAETFVYWSDWKKAVVPLSSLSLPTRTHLVLLKLRNDIIDHFHTSGIGESSLAVAGAMFLGDKSQLSKDLKDDYSIAGSSHILAISGLHLSILYGFLLFFFRRWRRSVPFLSLAILVVWAYVLLVGMPASAVRAAIMLTICTMVLMLHRRAVSLNTLSFAAILMLMVNPLNLFDVGFQLSFAAVFAILLWMSLAEPLFRWRTTAWWASSLRAVCGLLAVSLAAQLGTAPLVAYYFGRFSCYFLLTNLIAIPFAYLLLLMMVLTLLALPIPALLSVFLSVTAYLANLLNTAMHAVAHLPGASIDHLHPSAVQVLLIYVLLLTFYFICKIVIRRMKVS